MNEEMNVTEETTENNEMMEVENDDFAGYEDEGTGKVIALAVAGVAGAAALGVAAFKKLKAKADAKPSRKKKHLKVMWVEDEEPDVVADVEATEVTDDEKSEETEE